MAINWATDMAYFVPCQESDDPSCIVDFYFKEILKL